MVAAGSRKCRIRLPIPWHVSTYDAIVLGLGAMGSAAAAQLAARGRRVLGLEQFGPAHALGSSHGHSRVIRQAYYEDPAYVPLVLRAYELWHDLEQRCGDPLLLTTGALMAGAVDSELVAGSASSARQHGLAYEVLDANEIRRRYPAFHPRDDEVGIYEPHAGALFPERSVLAHLQWAASAGAELRFGVPAGGWSASENGVTVETEAGERFEAESLVICAGAWIGEILAGLSPHVRVERNLMHWFEPRADPGAFAVGKLPIFMLERRGEPVFYGFPEIPGQGIKISTHYTGDFTTPATLQRTVTEAEILEIRRLMSGWIPDASGAHLGSTACMYTNTPDLHFILGLHPKHERVAIAGGFSGHGFKFSPVVGEILADLVCAGRTSHPINLFDPGRILAAA